jgi:AmiR/NasT family two-component response regulator
MAEAIGSNPIQCGFESHPGHRTGTTFMGRPASGGKLAGIDRNLPKNPPLAIANPPVAVRPRRLGAATLGPVETPRRRVLIAEDEALIRLDLAEMLAEAGYDVVAQASDGEEAVELAREHTPDLVIMDVKMPRLDGIAAASIVAAERIAPIVMLTAFSQRELVDRARDAGAMAYLVKPFTITDLVPAIEMAASRFAEISALEREVEDLSERLAARKVIERAKVHLQQSLGLSEPDAFNWIQRTAMDLRMTMRQVAERVLADQPPK